jgi:hypothetical protein
MCVLGSLDLCSGDDDLANPMAGCTVSSGSKPQLAARSIRKRARAAGDDGGEDALCAKLISGCCVGGANDDDAADGANSSACGGLRRSGRIAARHGAAVPESFQTPKRARGSKTGEDLGVRSIAEERDQHRHKLRAQRAEGESRPYARKLLLSWVSTASCKF